MAKQALRFGVFGGTFNPIHNAHLMLAEDVREEFFLEKVLFIPTNLPPHKRVAGGIDPAHRLRMVRLAIQHNPHFQCDDIELKRKGVSYTVETVEYLYEKYGLDEKPHLIIGSDLVSEIDTWKKIETLAQKVHFVVLMRDGYPVEENRRLPRTLPGCSWYYFEKRKIAITSSEVRERVKRGRSIRYLVPETVLEYIRENRLYQPGLDRKSKGRGL